MSPATTSTLPSSSAATTGRAHHLCHDGKPPQRAAAAVDGMPALLHTDPAEGRAGHLPGGLSDAQQPPEILIAAIEDVTPDPLRDRLSHNRPPLPLRAREDLLCKACALGEERAAHRLDTAPPDSVRLAQAPGRHETAPGVKPPLPPGAPGPC